METIGSVPESTEPFRDHELTCHSPQGRTSAPAAIITTTKQARNYAADAKASPTEVSSILEQRIRGVQEEAGLAETGRVLSVGYASNNSNTAFAQLEVADVPGLTETVLRVCTE